MHMHEFSEDNRIRCESPYGFDHQINMWSLSDWVTATAGELGEAAKYDKNYHEMLTDWLKHFFHQYMYQATWLDDDAWTKT